MGAMKAIFKSFDQSHICTVSMEVIPKKGEEVVLYLPDKVLEAEVDTICHVFNTRETHSSSNLTRRQHFVEILLCNVSIQ